MKKRIFFDKRGVPVSWYVGDNSLVYHASRDGSVSVCCPSIKVKSIRSRAQDPSNSRFTCPHCEELVKCRSVPSYQVEV